MRKYEAMFIVQPNCVEEVRKSLISDINGVFSSETELEEMGTRQLAYEIEKHRSGYYVLITTDATSEEVNEFERVCRIKEDVIRFMIVRLGD